MLRVVTADDSLPTFKARWSGASIAVLVGAAFTSGAHATAYPAPHAPQAATARCDTLYYPVDQPGQTAQTGPTSPADLGYRSRGTYCEGVTRDLGRPTSFVPLSFTEGPRTADAWSPSSAFVSWQAPRPVRVRLSVAASAAGGTYRLEAVSDSGRFLWPRAVLARSGANTRDIGFLGRYEDLAGGEKQIIYVPVRTLAQRTANSGSYRLELMTPETVRDVRLAVSRIGNRPGKETLLYSEHVGSGFFGAGDRLRIEVGRRRLGQSGIYHAIITGTSPSRLLLHHFYFYAH